MRRGAALAGVLAAALPAVAPAAEATPRTLAEVLAWGKAHLTGVDDWHVVRWSEAGITFAGPDGVTLKSDGLAEADIRDELFRPMDLAGGKVRSVMARWTVDCKTGRHAALSMTLYRENNLKAQLAHRETETPNWLETDESDRPTVDAICEAVQKGKRLD